jgi:hypothetical protein
LTRIVLCKRLIFPTAIPAKVGDPGSHKAGSRRLDSRFREND